MRSTCRGLWNVNDVKDPIVAGVSADLSDLKPFDAGLDVRIEDLLNPFRTTTSVPPCSGLSRRGLETTERAARSERRPALTAPVRAGVHHVWVGAKKRDSKSNKETGMQEVENAVE